MQLALPLQQPLPRWRPPPRARRRASSCPASTRASPLAPCSCACTPATPAAGPDWPRLGARQSGACAGFWRPGAFKPLMLCTYPDGNPTSNPIMMLCTIPFVRPSFQIASPSTALALSRLYTYINECIALIGFFGVAPFACCSRMRDAMPPALDPSDSCEIDHLHVN